MVEINIFFGTDTFRDSFFFFFFSLPSYVLAGGVGFFVFPFHYSITDNLILTNKGERTDRPMHLSPVN